MEHSLNRLDYYTLGRRGTYDLCVILCQDTSSTWSCCVHFLRNSKQLYNNCELTFKVTDTSSYRDRSHKKKKFCHYCLLLIMHHYANLIFTCVHSNMLEQHCKYIHSLLFTGWVNSRNIISPFDPAVDWSMLISLH